MQWFYAKEGRQLGPIEEQELRALFREGYIDGNTLVWCPALPEWQPYSEVGPHAEVSAPPALPTARESALCVECARPFAPAQVLVYGGHAVCFGCKGVFTRRIAQGTLPQLGLEYVGFAPRFMAKIIDWVILGILQGALQGFFLVTAEQLEDPVTAITYTMAFSGVGLLLMLAYGGLFLGKFGATPGKMALGLKVITAQGEQPGYWRGLGRSAGELVSGLILYIGYVMVSFDPQRRALHDFMADTRVVKV